MYYIRTELYGRSKVEDLEDTLESVAAEQGWEYRSREGKESLKEFTITKKGKKKPYMSGAFTNNEFVGTFYLRPVSNIFAILLHHADVANKYASEVRFRLENPAVETQEDAAENPYNAAQPMH